MIAAIISPDDSEAAKGEHAEIPTGPVILTQRHVEIIINLMRKNSNLKTVAANLCIEVQTVEKHLEEIFRRTGCRKKHEAFLWMVANYGNDPEVKSAIGSYAAA